MLIEEFKATILFIGAEVEKDHSDKIISLMKNTPLNAVGACSLGQSAALMQKSKILICNNSGPMHIAASLHIPTISISGPVDKRIYSPWGSLGHIVLQKELECAPCYYSFLRDTLPETKRKNMWVGKTHRCNNNHLCLEKITENDVMEAVRTLITANK